jgi:hypothetical protein
VWSKERVGQKTATGRFMSNYVDEHKTVRGSLSVSICTKRTSWHAPNHVGANRVKLHKKDKVTQNMYFVCY